MNNEISDIERLGLLRSLCISGADDALRLWALAIGRELASVTDALTCRDIRNLCGAEDDLPTNALLAAMLGCLNQGSICLPLDSAVLEQEIDRLCGVRAISARKGRPASVVAAPEPAESLVGFTSVDIRQIAGAIIACVDSGKGLFADDVRKNKEPWPVRFEGGMLYFERLFGRERHLLAGLKALRDSGPVPLILDDPDNLRLKSIVDSVSRFNVSGADGKIVDVSLNSAQKLAVMLALRKRFLVVSGGPGTGKTRILASLLAAWRKAVIDQLSDQASREQAVRRILLVAPTGRAGKRMGESISAALGQMTGFDAGDAIGHQLLTLSGMTIHRALGFHPKTGGTVYGAEKRLPYDLVVCDEVSMVDLALMDNLISALRDDTRLIFMGDRDQLPSVEAGAVLGDIIPRVEGDGGASDFTPEFSPSTIDVARAIGILDAVDSDAVQYAIGTGLMADAVVMLTRSYRTRGNVTTLASQVNAGRTDTFEAPELNLAAKELCRPEVFSSLDSICSVVAGIQAKSTVRRKIVTAWLQHLYRDVPPQIGGVTAGQESPGLDSMFRAIGRVDYHEDHSSTHPGLMNALFDTLKGGRILCALREGPWGASGLNRLAAEIAGTRETFFPGCPVMITRNMHRLNLFNGETGIVMKSGGVLVAVFQQGDVFVSHPLATLGSCLPAFAGTVHKSQGSEYGNVIVVLPDDPDHRLMTREILYTAMTRSSNNVWIIGDRKVLSAAIGRRTARYSGLDLWS